jgi:DNA/RNA endonuclease G (NUC1)
MRLFITLGLAFLLCVSTSAVDAALRAFYPSSKAPVKIVEHETYAVGWDSQRHEADWVVFDIQPGRSHIATRDGVSFVRSIECPDAVDPKLYAGHASINIGHYKCAASAEWSELAMRETFYMENTSPQDQNDNCGDYKQIESAYLSEGEKQRVIVILGPVHGNTLLSGAIPIPAARWIIVKNMKGIVLDAWLIPYAHGNATPDAYKTTGKKIEESTSLSFTGELSRPKEQ